MSRRPRVVLLLTGCAPLAQLTSSTNPAPVLPADPTNPVARGEQLFATQPRGKCHRLQEVPGATGAVGPDLSHVASVAAQRRPGLSAEDYVRDSIVEPDAFTVPGYPRGVMPKVPLQPQQMDDLVAFLLTRQ